MLFQKPTSAFVSDNHEQAIEAINLLISNIKPQLEVLADKDYFVDSGKSKVGKKPATYDNIVAYFTDYALDNETITDICSCLVEDLVLNKNDDFTAFTHYVKHAQAFFEFLAMLPNGETLPLDEFDDFICYVENRLSAFNHALEISLYDTLPQGAGEKIFRAINTTFYAINR